MLQSESRYRLKWTRCNKPECRQCSGGGKGHGPYWFEYRRESNGTKRIYLGRRSPFDNGRIGRSHQNEFVGRASELEQLLNQFGIFDRLPKTRKRPIRSSSQIHFSLLQGDAGIGKTRLAEELAVRAQQQSWKVAWGRTYAQETLIPYRLWSDALRTLVGLAVLPSRESMQQDLLILSSLVPELQELAEPLHQDLFTAPDQIKLWEAVYHLAVSVSSSSHPLLIVLDDIQWADQSSLDLLLYLARRIEEHPVFFLATCRDAFPPPIHALIGDLLREKHLVRLTIAPLAEEHIALLLASLSLPAPFIHYIQQHSVGNPYFAEELAKEIIRSAPDQSLLPTTLKIPLPQSIASLLGQRIGRLSPACQRLLTKAAVLASSFTGDLLDEVEQATTDGSPVPRVNMIDILDEAVHAGILVEEGSGAQITYRFWHQLLQDLLYAQLSATRRADYHRKIAEVLQARLQQGEELDDLDLGAIIVRHLALGGGEKTMIAHFAEIAGNRAYGLSAYAEAEQYYQQVLEQISSLSAPESSGEHEALLCELVGECARCLGKYQEARQWYEASLQRIPQQSAMLSEQEKQQLVQQQSMLLCEIGFSQYSQGNLDQALEAYQASEATLRAERVSGGSALAYLRYRQSYVYWRRGMYREALTLANTALSLQEELLTTSISLSDARSVPQTQLRRILAGDPVQSGRVHQLIGLIFISLGNTQQTIKHWEAARTIFEHHSSKRDLAVINCNLGDIHLRKADHAAAQIVLQQARQLAEQIGERPLESAVLGNLGVLALRLGTLSEAEAWLRRGLVCAEQIHDTVHLAILQAHLTVALAEQKKIAEAEAMITRALEFSEALQIPPIEGVISVARAHLYLAQARARKQKESEKNVLTQAEHILSHLLDEEIEAETKTEARLLLGQIKAKLGDVEQAHVLATQGLEEAIRYDLVWLVAQAHQTLAAILVLQKQLEEATAQYQQALQLFQKTGMRLEYSRTLKEYNQVLEARLTQTTPADSPETEDKH